MTSGDRQPDLEQRVASQVERARQARRERSTLLAQTMFAGVLGIVFVLPVIGGAYLGRWLDAALDGYSVRWTISLIVLGVIVGAINVYLLLKE